MNYYAMDFDTMLHRLTDLKKKYSAELELLEHHTPGCLYGVKRHGTQNYLQAQTCGDKCLRRGITGNPDILRELCQKAYLKEALKNITDDIKCLSAAKAQFLPLDSDKIIQNLPEVYRTLPEEYFFPEAYKDLLADAAEKDDEIAAKVKAWCEEPYEKSNYMQEKKVHTTSQGEKMRSKNEVLHAEIMYRLNIPFRYEPVLRMEQYTFIPDFEALRVRDAKIFYLEHCGMPHNKEYMLRHKRKTEIYESFGIVPWDNLIVTYGDINGNLDLRTVESEIRSRLL